MLKLLSRDLVRLSNAALIEWWMSDVLARFGVDLVFAVDG